MKMRLRIQYSFCIVFFWILTASCEKLTLDGYGREAEEFFRNQSPQSVIEDDKGHYSIIFSNDSTNVKGLDDLLRSFSRIRFLENESDSVVVILGITEYEESQKALKEIDGVGFNIKVKGNQVLIVGSDETWTALALYELEGVLLPDDSTSEENVLVIPDSLHIKYESRDPQLIAQLIHKGYRFSLQPDLVMSFMGQGECSTPQGVACDGEFFYFVLRNSADTQSIVFKYDMLSLKEMGHSAVLNTGHSNDMTFNPDIESLIIAHGKSQGDRLTLINPDNLSVSGNVRINVGAGAISYNRKRKQYALSQGGTTLHIADMDFNILQSFSRQKMNGYTAQGMGSDDSFVYFPMSGFRKNILLAYDWEGTLVSTLDLGLSYESESMFYANGDYYVCCNYYGTSLFRLKPRLTYHFIGREN